MNKVFCLILLLMIALSFLFSAESDDFKFIIGLYKDKNFDLARTELESFIKKYPESIYLNDMRYLLGGIYFNNNDYNHAEHIYKRLYNEYQNPKFRGDIVLNYAQTNYFLDKKENAEKLFKEFIAGFAAHAQIWKAEYFLARIASDKQDYQRALEYVNNSLNKQKDVRSISLKVAILSSLNKIEETRTVVRQMIAEYPEDDYTAQSILLFYQHLLKKSEFREIVESKGTQIKSISPYYKQYMEIMTIAAYETGNFSIVREYAQKAGSERSDYYSALAAINLGDSTNADIILQKLADSAKENDIKAAANFYLAKLSAEKDPAKAKTMLEGFVLKYPDNTLIPEAFYQLGLLDFARNDFNLSIDYFNKALKAGIQGEYRERAEFLIAENTFRNGNSNQTESLFKGYLKNYPDGLFIPETLSNLGLIYFEKKDYSASLITFKKIVNEHPDYGKIWLAHSFIGDIYQETGEYQLADNEYKKALENSPEKDILYIKIAQLQLNNKDYDKSHDELKKVTDSAKTGYHKYLLQGNIYFAQKLYKSALSSYQKAEPFAADAKSKEEILNKQAWVYYQLKQYNDSFAVYKKLADITGNSGQYLFMTATTAFNAEKYNDAVTFFRDYTNRFPEQEKYYDALLGLADSYYNMGKLDEAMSYYKSLIKETVPDNIFMNALNGLEWSALQMEGYNFAQLMDELLISVNKAKPKAELINRKIKFLSTEQDWDKLTSTINELFTLNPAYKKDVNLNLTLAFAYYQKGKLVEAERIYSESASSTPTAEVYYEWAKFQIFKGDKSAGIDIMRKATEISRNQEIWLELLTLEENTDDNRFETDFPAFLSFATGLNLERAKLLQINKFVKSQQFLNAQQIINDLSNSEHDFVKANAQYYKGFLLYKQGQYEEAIPELLRVRYLYPNINDVKNRSDAIACLAYLRTGKPDKARQLYDTIKDELDKPTRTMLEEELGGN